MRKIYLDYAASTPIDPRVLRAMEPYFSEKFGNPGSIHSFGQEALGAIDKSREIVANACGTQFRDVIFTGSATEANNLALRGLVCSVKYQTLSIKYPKKPRIITTKIEHESILETCRALEKEGVEIVYLPVDNNGVVDVDQIKKEINAQTILVSIGYANNEIGAIQPIQKIGAIIKEARGVNQYPFFHTDAVQAFQYLNCNLTELGVDLMTISAHKIYGPKGIGALIMRAFRDSSGRLKNGVFLPIINGGGQEFGLRSGTENVPAIVGFAKAVEIMIGLRAKEARRINLLRDYFEKI